MRNDKKMQEKELESVTGGSCYSDDTYAKLGIALASYDRQKPDNHPLIVTSGNSCSDHSGFSSGCVNCSFSQVSGVTLYCRRRSDEFDPHNPHQSKWIHRA